MVEDLNLLEGRLKPLQGSVLSYNSGKFLEFARICLPKKEENKTHSIHSPPLACQESFRQELPWLTCFSRKLHRNLSLSAGL